MEQLENALTERQQKELEYHREHYAGQHSDILSRPFSYDVIHARTRRWWIHYWAMYDFILGQSLNGKRVLVVGCGFGDDALRLSKLGADVYAFDLSPEALAIARELAAREGSSIDFRQMTAEKLEYESDFFDCIVARDILHHVDIPQTMREVVRVSRKGALFVVNEVYSHSVLDRIRHSRIVERYLYPRMQSIIYEGEKPYITEDERKLTEWDVGQVVACLERLQMEKHFNLFVNRVIPSKYTILYKIDRAMLVMMRPIARLLAGRIMFAGAVRK